MIGVFLFVPPLRNFANNFFFGVFFACLLVSIVLLIVLFCVRRIRIVNIITLTAFTVVFSIAIGMVTANYGLTLILQAAIITFAVTIFLSGLVIVTRAKLMWMGSLLCALLMVLIFTSLIGSLFSFVFRISPWWHMLVSGFAALLFSMFIAYDTSMMIHRYADDEAMMASVNLYLDIVNLFLALLSILGFVQGGGARR